MNITGLQRSASMVHEYGQGTAVVARQQSANVQRQSLGSHNAKRALVRPQSSQRPLKSTRPQSATQKQRSGVMTTRRANDYNLSTQKLDQKPRLRQNSSMKLKTMESISKRSTTISVKDFLFNDPKKEWCLDGYSMPLTHWHQVSGTIDKDNIPKYLSVFNESKPDLNLNKVFLRKKIPGPSPCHYKVKSFFKSSNMGQFAQEERATMTVQVMKRAKKNKHPAPGYHINLKKKQLPGFAATQDIKSCYMIDEARTQGKSTPGFDYDPNHTQVQSRSSSVRYYPQERVKVYNSHKMKLKKNNVPGPASYESNRVFTEKKSTGVAFGKADKKTYIDDYLQKKKVVPSPGLYESHRGEKVHSRPLSAYTRKRL